MASMAINPAIYPKLPYTPQRDFVPISLVASYPYILAVKRSAPIRTVRELTDYTRANPSKANAGCAAATMQLLTEMFKQRTGAQIQCILYKGTNDAILLSSRANYCCHSLLRTPLRGSRAVNFVHWR